jgi:hypothetical protein
MIELTNSLNDVLQKRNANINYRRNVMTKILNNQIPTTLDDCDVICPFCGEGDFDLVGLKMHLLRGWCDKLNETSIDVPRTRDTTLLAKFSKNK